MRVLHIPTHEHLYGSELTKSGLPYIGEFVRTASEIGRLTDDQLTRIYQLQLLASGTVYVASPFTGQQIWVNSSFILRNQMIFYGLADVAPVYIVASSLGAGYPITGAYFPEHDLLMQLGLEIEWAPRPEHVAQLAPHFRQAANALQHEFADRLIVTGDQNFAHCAWNELGALHRIATSDLLHHASRIIATSEPLGPVEELFPELSGVQIIRMQRHEAEALNEGRNLFISPGGITLTTSVRNRILDVARDNQSEIGKELEDRLRRKQSLPTFWISVRTRNRTAINQIEFLATVLRALHANFGYCNIILDGHSLPMDSTTNAGIDNSLMIDIAMRDKSEVDKILQKASINEPGFNVYCAVGLPILDSIQMAAFADFYICHHGTIQHKIGWFHPTPGVAHTNRVYLESHPGAWVAAQSEVAIEPFYLAPAWVKDLDRPEAYKLYPEHMQLQNYEITDIPAATTFIIEHARRTVQR